MPTRKTIGENPLDAFISPAEMKNSLEVVSISQKNTKRVKKQRITIQISEEVIDRIKNAVYWTPGLTLASLAEQALSVAVDQLEKQRGASFQERASELKTGRPIK